MTTVVAIIPTTPELLDIEEQSLEALVRALHVGAPPDWPPEFSDERYRRWQRGLLSAHPDDPGYAGYYLIGNGELVGTCGFKGPPGDDGLVEIGYSVIVSRRRRGFASDAVGLLVERAFVDPRVHRVLAETLTDAAASQGVLRRCGFQPAGRRVDAEDGEIVRFELRRQQ